MLFAMFFKNFSLKITISLKLSKKFQFNLAWAAHIQRTHFQCKGFPPNPSKWKLIYLWVGRLENWPTDCDDDDDDVC